MYGTSELQLSLYRIYLTGKHLKRVIFLPLVVVCKPFLQVWIVVVDSESLLSYIIMFVD